MPSFNMGQTSESAVRLPLFDEFERMNQVDDVEEEIVANGQGENELDDQQQRDRGPGGDSGGQEKAEGGEEDVKDGIEDAVAVVAGGQGGAAIALDDHRGVFENLPGTFGEHGEEEAEGQGEFSAALGEEAEDGVENQAVDEVGEGIGVGDLLGELRGGDGGPEEDAVGLADGEAVHGIFDEGGEGNEKKSGEKVGVEARASVTEHVDKVTRGNDE
jgi:hypothetical protein